MGVILLLIVQIIFGMINESRCVLIGWIMHILSIIEGSSIEIDTDISSLITYLLGISLSCDLTNTMIITILIKYCK